MKLRVVAALALAGAAAPAFAGPPYATDDPFVTDLAHWEVYAFSTGDGTGFDFDDDTGVELNYGIADRMQVTATLPLSFSHERTDGWRSGTGDVEVGAKYQLLREDKDGLSAAVFPRAILPTSNIESRERTRLLLPLWVGKDFGRGTTVFGGGGYEINPGPANRNFWQAGIAVTHDLNNRLTIGAEVTRQGADTVGGTAQTSAGVGSTFKLTDHCSLLASGGPTWADRRTGYHFYGALGLFF